jgi:hypothetical protein
MVCDFEWEKITHIILKWAIKELKTFLAFFKTIFTFEVFVIIELAPESVLDHLNLNLWATFIVDNLLQSGGNPIKELLP